MLASPSYEICFSCIPATCNEICEFILGAKLPSDPCYFSLALTHALLMGCIGTHDHVDWLKSLKHIFINESYHILVASLTLTV